MSLLSDVLATLTSRNLRRRMLSGPDSRSTEALIADLLSGHGEISGMTTAAQILDRYSEMEDEAKITFFDHLSNALGIDPATVRAALDAFEAEPGKVTYGAFLEAAEPGARGDAPARRHAQRPAAADPEKRSARPDRS